MRNSTGSSCLFSFLGGISFNLVEEEQQKGVVHGQESMRAIIACEATKQFHKNNQALFFQLVRQVNHNDFTNYVIVAWSVRLQRPARVERSQYLPNC